MEYERLFIWVEGEDDLRFFNRIIKPAFEGKYNLVEVRTYAALKRQKVSNYLRSINAMDAAYIFVTDMNQAPCITARKEEIEDKFRNVDKDKVIVVIKEIESWYLAGLDDACSKKCGIRPCNTTDTIIKEQFDNMTPKKFISSRIDFLQEILKYFQVEIAKQKNESFRYFLTDFLIKYGLG